MNTDTGTAHPSGQRVGEFCQYLTFALGQEQYSMDIRTVREIIQYAPMTTLPLMPAFVRGVINLRGAVVPVIDLRARFGQGLSEVSKKTCIVIFEAQHESERLELGLMVDAVHEVIDVTADRIEAPPNFGTAVRRDFIRGMVKKGERFVIVLDPDRAFDIDEMSQLCDAAQEQGSD